MKRTKRRLKRWIRILLLVILLLLILFVFIFWRINNSNNGNNTSKKSVIKEIEKDILGEYVKTNKKVILYSEEYKKIGEVNENTVLHITSDKNNYYKVEDLDDVYYVKGDDLSNYDEEIIINDRYKKYIPFNKNIKTDSSTLFYDKDSHLVYTINKSMNFPVVIMDDDKVGVIFNHKILYIKQDDKSEIVDNNNTSDKNTSGIGVLNYHFFYDESKEGEASKCNQDICMSLSSLRKQLDYIKENNYFTPTMNEFEMYIDGKIQLPKSVVITIDDGWRAIEGLNVINDYKLNATIFVITGSYNANDFKKEYIEVHSHSENMHKTGDCPNGQGGGIQCLPEETILNDLRTSSEKLGGSKVFCYPFYEYNNYSISMLKKAGYTMAFAGENKGSNNMTTPGINKYSIPRFVMVNYTTMDDFSRYLKGQFYS